MSHKISIDQKRKNRENDAWVLFVRNKIEMPEYHRLLELIRSPDEGNLCVAQAIIKAKFTKKKKS